jgi:type III pantothenate kinase
MILLCDIGNTRFKWALLDRDHLGPQHAEACTRWGKTQLRNRVLAPAGDVSRVVVSNVAGVKIAELLTSSVRERWGIEPEFIHSAPNTAGVVNAYLQAGKLGVDRWCALIGAHHMQRAFTCIVSVGTAATIDALMPNGRHLGGLIVPGPDLMISSLMRNTSNIAAFAADGDSNEHFLADNTLGAVQQGAVHALAALVERTIERLREQHQSEPVLLLTGGACERIEPILRIPFTGVPDVVLRGLAVIANQAGK